MADSTSENLLARLAGRGNHDGLDPWASIAATLPQHAKAASEPAKEKPDNKLEELLSRITSLQAEPQLCSTPSPTFASTVEFIPLEPKSFYEAQLTSSEVEALLLKILL